MRPTLETTTLPEVEIPSISERIKIGWREGVTTLIKLLKFVFPLYILVSILQQTQALEPLGTLFSPLMAHFGLPGETAFAFIAAFSLNIYAAIAVLAPLQLTPFEVTQCGLMMGIAHNLLLEGGVLSGTGTRGITLTLCRLIIAAVAGLILVTIRPVIGL